MKIFIDFDDTIFAKSDLKKVIDYELRKKFGLTQHIIDQSYVNVKRSGIKHKRSYTIERHVKILSERTGIDIESFRSFFDRIYSGDLSGYIYVDVVQTLRKLGVHQRILLTFGDHDFQMSKIRNAGVYDLFDDVIITEDDKYDVMCRSTHGHETLILVDDKTIYFPAMKMDKRQNISIHKISRGMSCSEGSCDHHIVGLSEIYDILCT